MQVCIGENNSLRQIYCRVVYATELQLEYYDLTKKIGFNSQTNTLAIPQDYTIAINFGRRTMKNDYGKIATIMMSDLNFQRHKQTITVGMNFTCSNS